MIGTKLAHYEITSHLGTGGMGEVYQATDSKLGRNVAIKLLPDAFTKPGSGEQTNVGAPIWSTDSRYLAFTGSGALMKVAVEGGTPQKRFSAGYR